MSDKPAVYRLSVLISLAFVIIFSIYSYWSFNFNKNLIRKNAENEARLVASAIKGTVYNKILTVRELNHNFSQHFPYIVNTPELENLMVHLLERYDYISSLQVYIDRSPVDNQRIIYMAERFSSGIKYAEYPGQKWFCGQIKMIVSSLEEEVQPAWSDAYKCSQNDDLVVLYYLPFTFENHHGGQPMTGFIASEVSLGFLSKAVAETKIGKQGFAFLIADDGTFITHPNPEYVLKSSIFKLPKEVFSGEVTELQDAMNEDFGGIIINAKTLGGKRSIAFHSKLEFTNWVLAIILPVIELNRDLYWLLAKTLLMMAAVIAIIFILVNYISTKVMKPISEAAHEIQVFSNEKTLNKLQIRNEAQALSNSLKHLRRMYEDFKISEVESKEAATRYMKEIEMASEIQQSIIPKQGLWVDQERGIKLYSVFKPANVLSGDLFDFFMIDDKHLLITIGDVTGSNVSAALFMGVAHTFIKTYAKDNSPKAIVKLVNEELCHNNNNQYFLTLFLGILNVEDGTLVYCNAGHTPAFFIRYNGIAEKLTDVHGVPLGLMPEKEYNEGVIHLEPRDKLFLYTDGITEQAGIDGKLYGEDHLYNFIRLHMQDAPELMAVELLNQIEVFTGTQKQSDDLSFVILNLLEPYKVEKKVRIFTS